MLEIIVADAVIHIAPTNTKPIPEVIAEFAERAGCDQWYALVIGKRFIIVQVIEEPLS